MQVCVGSLCDPDSYLGLAHFTEHMLFYSSERYPKVTGWGHNQLTVQSMGYQVAACVTRPALPP